MSKPWSWRSLFSRFTLVNREKLDAEIQSRIDAAIIESQKWGVNGEGDDIISQISAPDRSIWEEMDYYFVGDKRAAKIGDKVTLKNVMNSKEYTVEAEKWISVGLDAGQDPSIEQTLGTLRLQQNAALYQWVNMPIARSAVENTKRYVIGRGVKIECPVPEIQDVIAKFWRQNSMETRVKSDYRMYLINGETFYKLHDATDDPEFDPDVQAVVKLTPVSTFQIEQVEANPEDREEVLSYQRTYLDTVSGKPVEEVYLDEALDFGDEVSYGLPTGTPEAKSKNSASAKPDRMIQFKNGLTFDLRGRSFLEVVLMWNRVLSDFVWDRSRLNHLRSKIYLIETRTGKGGKVLGSAYEKMPKGGIKLVETAERKFRYEAMNTQASDAKEDGLLIVYNIASGLAIPIHVLFMNAENNNYASIREAANPFVQMIHDQQDDLAENTRRLIRFVLKTAIRAGILKDEYAMEYYSGDTVGEEAGFIVKRMKDGAPLKKILAEAEGVFGKPKTQMVKTLEAPIHVIMPEIAQADIEKVAAAVEKYVNTGLMSKATAMEKIGVDSDAEQARIDEESAKADARRAEMIKQLGVGNPGGPGGVLPFGGDGGNPPA